MITADPRSFASEPLALTGAPPGGQVDLAKVKALLMRMLAEPVEVTAAAWREWLAVGVERARAAGPGALTDFARKAGIELYLPEAVQVDDRALADRNVVQAHGCGDGNARS